jgi:LuxR family transcriptional regulator, maltose regulon positive regulatory protein
MTAMISDSSARAHGEGKPSARSVAEHMSGGIRDIFARPRPGQDDRPATAVLTPFHDVTEACRVWMAAAFMLGAIARDMLCDADAVGRVLQRALDLTEPDQVLPPFLVHPPPRLAPPGTPTRHFEDLSYGEVRVLRYLQTNLSAREIAGVLSVSVNTVKTHQRHLYQKLGAHSRTQAVEQARALGLLAPSARRR